MSVKWLQNNFEDEIVDTFESCLEKVANEFETRDKKTELKAMELLSEAAANFELSGKNKEANIVKVLIATTCKVENPKNPGKTKKEKEMYKFFGYNNAKDKDIDDADDEEYWEDD